MNKLTCAAAVDARMAKVLLWLGVAATALSLGAPANAACNIRGEHCGRPAWAANAFSGPYGRAPESALESPTHGAARSSPSQMTYVKKAVRERVVRKAAPLVRFADDFGREFDAASNVWFDGKGQCWWGRKKFTHKNGDWYYGSEEWAEVDGAWNVVSGGSPELVSCESVASFAAKAAAMAAKANAAAAKAQAAAAKAHAASAKANVAAVEAEPPLGKSGEEEDGDDDALSQPAPVKPRPATVKSAEKDPATIKMAEKDPAAAPLKPAPERVCKRYFASVGQMIVVPCLD
jgi:hypothetical protein